MSNEKGPAKVPPLADVFQSVMCDPESKAEALIFAYARAHDPAIKEANNILNGIVAAEEGWNGSDFTREPTGISKLARSALRTLGEVQRG